MLMLLFVGIRAITNSEHILVIVKLVQSVHKYLTILIFYHDQLHCGSDSNSQ